ncbi:hypothetical protein N0V86_000067 [Didymella sp. IMI 355093]|nr:hypothetical protein N0V86_000067 [Didymella sp. IMI 355093]
MPPDAAPEAQPFRLLDLPAEMRNRIYEFMVARDEITLTYRDSNGLIDDQRPIINNSQTDVRPMMQICRASRQVHNEVMPLFYAKTTLCFDADHNRPGKNSVVLATAFLKSRPGSLYMIQRFGIHLDEAMDENSYASIRHISPGELRDLCEQLAYGCRLKYLRLYVCCWVFLEPMEFDAAMAKFGKSEPTHSVPDWAIQLAIIKDLERLEVRIDYEGVGLVHRTVAATQFMRYTMVQGGSRMLGMEGIKLQLPHGIREDRLTKEREFSCDMDVEKGKSLLVRERRVKVLPYAWCMTCGKFARQRGCECNPVAGKAQCFRGVSGQSKHFVRIKDEDWTAHDTTRSAVLEGKLSLDQTTLNSLYGCDVWDIRRWGGGGIRTYLPEGVTDEDLRYTMFLVKDDDFDPCLPDYHGYSDGMESDFGDTDSLLSIHWDDVQGQLQSNVPSRAYGTYR